MDKVAVGLAGFSVGVLTMLLANNRKPHKPVPGKLAKVIIITAGARA